MKFKHRDELTKWALGSSCLWLFLDYDGTLADFAPTPDHVEPDPEIISQIEQLARSPRIRVTVLSGRRLQHIRHLLPVPGIFLAGTYGIELLEKSGVRVNRAEYSDVRPVMERIKPRWEGLIRGREGFYLEDKGWTLALHARFADDWEAGEVLARARQMVDSGSSARHMRVLGGHKFLEIAPQPANKRGTVAYLLEQHPLPGSRLLYIGDDDKDEEAFPLIHEHHGVAVKVVQPSQIALPTAADFLFHSPAETLQWLQELA